MHHFGVYHELEETKKCPVAVENNDLNKTYACSCYPSKSL